MSERSSPEVGALVYIDGYCEMPAMIHGVESNGWVITKCQVGGREEFAAWSPEEFLDLATPARIDDE